MDVGRGAHVKRRGVGVWALLFFLLLLLLLLLPLLLLIVVQIDADDSQPIARDQLLEVEALTSREEKERGGGGGKGADTDIYALSLSHVTVNSALKSKALGKWWKRTSNRALYQSKQTHTNLGDSPI